MGRRRRRSRPKKAGNRFPRPGGGLNTLPGGKQIVGDYIGIDECGVGALAGPMVFCAVAIKEGVVPGVKDSKLISTPEARRALAEQIKAQAVAWKVAEISPKFIDENGMDSSWNTGACSVLLEIRKECDWVAIIDGKDLPTQGDYINAIPKADQSVYQVAAASIVGKSYRDQIMLQAEQQYPNYNFSKHQGYPTKQHYDELRKHGSCAVHRKSLKAVQNPSGKIKREELKYTPEKAQEFASKLTNIDQNMRASDWEKQFAKDMMVRVSQGRSLSPRQMFFLQAVAKRRGK